MDSRESKVNLTPDSNRHIVVLDRGWIFVGNLVKLDGDMYLLTDAKNIRKWSGYGFGGLTISPKKAATVLDDSLPVQFHQSAVIFMVPVSKDWDNE